MVLVLLLLVAGVAAYFALAMPGMDHGAMSAPSERSAIARLSPAEFAARLERGSAFVVNVHTPPEGDLAGTDVSIRYDRIVGDPRLPADKGAEILLYCRTGRMSAQAAVALRAEGYTNVADLAGGMQAWEATGRQVIGALRT